MTPTGFKFEIGTKVHHVLHDFNHDVKGIILAREIYETHTQRGDYYHVQWIDGAGNLRQGWDRCCAAELVEIPCE